MKLDQGKILLVSAVIVGAPRWAGAMLAADVGDISGGLSTLLHWMNVVSGIGMAPLEALAIAFMWDALRTMKPVYYRQNKKRRNIQWYGTALFAVALLVLTPMILAPYIMSRMNGVGMVGVLPTPTAQAIWSVGVTFAPVAILSGVAFAQSGLVSMTGGTQKKRTNDAVNRRTRKSELSVQEWADIRKSVPATTAELHNVSVRTAQIWKNEAKNNSGMPGVG